MILCENILPLEYYLELFSVSYKKNRMSESTLRKKASEGGFRVRQGSEQMLRSKIKALEGQVETLQTGINVFADIRQKGPLELKSSSKSLARCDHAKLIEELRSRVSRLENKSRALAEEKRAVEKRLEETERELRGLTSRVEEVEAENEELEKENK